LYNPGFFPFQEILNIDATKQAFNLCFWRTIAFVWIEYVQIPAKPGKKNGRFY
jgi:hypothetical protein